MKRMPRLLVQLLAGNLITALPLLAGIGYALVSLEAIGQRQQDLLIEGVAASQAGDAIASRLARLERAVRQYRVLGDPAFRAVAETVHRQLGDLLGDARQPRPGALPVSSQPALVLRQHLDDVPRLLDEPGPDGELAAFFARAVELRLALRAEIQRALEARLAGMQAERAALRERLVLLGGLAIALTVATALVASLLVARPLRNLMGIVQRLGVGNWQRPVQLSGPADLVELGTRLEWLRCQLIASDTQKKAFARDVTHELKTPLAAVVEACSLLADGIPGPVNAQQQQVLGLLRDNAAALQELIDELLHYDSITLADQADGAPYPLRELVDATVAPLASLAATRQLQWDVDGEALRCGIEPRRLRLLIANLLSNAVRHSPRGGRLSLHWRRNAHVLELAVTDDGEGIASEHIEQIFEPFYTGRANAGPARRGTGLGLTIVRECVVQLGGNIRVSNAAGRGACFEVALPMPPVEHAR